MGEIIGTKSHRIRVSVKNALVRDNVLRLRDEEKRPKVKRVKKINNYERVLPVKFFTGSHDKLAKAGAEISASLKWFSLKNWQVSDVNERLGGNYFDFTLTDMSHSFRYVFDNPSQLLIDKVGRYSLQENHEIDLVKRPHLAILGQTSSGKSYLLMSLLYQYLAEGDTVLGIDPKNAELAKIAEMKGLVYSNFDNDKPTPIEVLDMVIDEMNKRQAELAKIDKLAVNAIDDLGYKAFHLVLEELSSALNEMPKKVAEEFTKKLEVIARKGRSAGIYLTLLTQTFTVGSFGNAAIREQVQNIIALGTTTATQRSMVFPTGVEIPESSFKGEKGVGWAYFDGMPVFKVEAPTFKADLYQSLLALPEQS